MGGNTKKAIKAFQRANGMKETGISDRTLWERLRTEVDFVPLVAYVITEKDIAGPFEPTIPDALEEKAKLEQLAYTGPDELLAEKFHMDIVLLKRLNPGKALGTIIMVANVGRRDQSRAARLEVDKTIGGVFAFDQKDAIIAFMLN